MVSLSLLGLTLYAFYASTSAAFRYQNWQKPFGTSSNTPTVGSHRLADTNFGTLNNFSVTTLHLSSITSEDGYTTLTHPGFPGHGVRVKKTDFCDPTVNGYTGYLDVDQGSKHLFFYFFESRRNPDKDDVMMWINGGPGCSSSMGLLMELGPCNIDMNFTSTLESLKQGGNGTVWNPFSWNSEANIFFLDQPVGVGFSYADHGETVETTEDAAKNIHAFISIFFETFSQFQGRPLHLSGESYGGRYLPVFASEIYDQNRIAAKSGRPTINLQSVIIGNGITDISTLYPGRYAVECGTDALEVPFQKISTCVRMKQALPRCQAAMDRNCVEAFDEMNCRAAVNFCDQELSTPLRTSGRNNYDISKPCLGGSLCYLEVEVIQEFLRQPDLLAKLGVESPLPFTGCSGDVGNAFNAHFDKFAVPTQYHVAGLLDRGVRVLIYAGTYDWQCNWVANKLWVDKLEWSGSEEYARTAWRNWSLNGVKAGETKTWGNLTFATVRGAGHMMSTVSFYLSGRFLTCLLFVYVPHDKPAESLAMVSRWLAEAGL
ncbi:peptidase S10 serine carboxypeptidase [Amylostereum chailletii]|nr:peptidase S10 serine carboxypeptidase [Amylostereum chailletii]